MLASRINLLKAIADETRLRILCILSGGERSVKDLTLQETGIVMATWGATPIFAAVGLGMLSDRFGRKSVILATAYPGAAVADGDSVVFIPPVAGG